MDESSPPLLRENCETSQFSHKDGWETGNVNSRLNHSCGTTASIHFRVKNSQLNTHEKLSYTPDTLTLGTRLSREDSRVDYAGYFSAYFVILCVLEALLSIVTLRAVFYVREADRISLKAPSKQFFKSRYDTTNTDCSSRDTRQTFSDVPASS